MIEMPSRESRELNTSFRLKDLFILPEVLTNREEIIQPQTFTPFTDYLIQNKEILRNEFKYPLFPDLDFLREESIEKPKGEKGAVRYNRLINGVAQYNPYTTEITFGLQAAILAPETLTAAAHHEQTHMWFDSLSVSQQQQIVDTLYEENRELVEAFYSTTRIVYSKAYFSPEHTALLHTANQAHGGEGRYRRLATLNNAKESEVVDVALVVDELLAFAHSETHASDDAGQNPVWQLQVQIAQDTLRQYQSVRDAIEAFGYDDLHPDEIITKLMAIPDFQKDVEALSQARSVDPYQFRIKVKQNIIFLHTFLNQIFPKRFLAKSFSPTT